MEAESLVRQVTTNDEGSEVTVWLTDCVGKAHCSITVFDNAGMTKIRVALPRHAVVMVDGDTYGDPAGFFLPAKRLLTTVRRHTTDHSNASAAAAELAALVVAWSRSKE
jgi:hypothetical protein